VPLPKPSLDTRSFAQLSEESIALLPEVAPLWTDHNVSNAGVTLAELLAWLCEMDLYRLDRITDEAIRGFLRLVGIVPLPAQVAQTVLAIEAAAELELPAGLQLQTAFAAQSAPVVYQSVDAVLVSAAKLARVIAGDGADVTARNAAGDDPYLPFGSEASADAALYLGFQAALATPGKRVSLYAWTGDPAHDAQLRARLVAEYEEAEKERSETCPVTLREHPPWWQHYQVRTVWEYFAADASWKQLADVLDHTRALTLTGSLGFVVPADHSIGGIAVDGSLFGVRCRVVTPGFECPGRIAKIAINAVHAEHAADSATTLGVSRGRAHERYAVKLAPIVQGSTRLVVTVGAEVQSDWQEVVHWDLSGPHDRHYRLDTERNAIECGDGRRGIVAAATAKLELSYRTGGDTRGNVPAHSLLLWLDNAHNQALVPGWSALVPTLKLRQPFASFGGAAAESLKAAVARAIEETRTPPVVLTLMDFELAALATPGVAVARARAIADLYPPLPCFRASGDVTVVVIPDCGGPRPAPSEGMLAAVRRWLERRRSPATLLHVSAPTYREVAVAAKLHAAADADRESVRSAAIAAIDVFLNPLRGGPDGRGWQVGRTVFRSEILALLASVPGVASVTGVGLQGEHDAEPRCENLPLCDEELPTPGRHSIAVIAAPKLRIIDRSHPHECP
jgi:hypothetical protein